VGVAVCVGVDVGVPVGVGVKARVGVTEAAAVGVAVGSTITGVAVEAGPHAANNKRPKHITTLLLESRSFIFSPFLSSSVEDNASALW